MGDEYFDYIPLFQTENLILKEASKDCWKELVEIAVYSEYAASKDGVEQLISQLKLDFENKQSISWGIFMNDVLIGTCGYDRGFENGCSELGFVMRTEYRRKGYMREALSAIINFGFNKLNLKSIFAYTKNMNKGAISLLQNLEFNHASELTGDYLCFNKTHRSK